jgi:hypothetical protein
LKTRAAAVKAAHVAAISALVLLCAYGVRTSIKAIGLLSRGKETELEGSRFSVDNSDPKSSAVLLQNRILPINISLNITQSPMKL